VRVPTDRRYRGRDVRDRSPETAAAPVPPAEFQEQTVYSGLNPPINVESAPDGRVFVAEKGGWYVITARVSRLQTAGNVMTGSEQVLPSGWCQQFPATPSATSAPAPTACSTCRAAREPATTTARHAGQPGQRVRRAARPGRARLRALGGANGRVLTTAAELAPG